MDKLSMSGKSSRLTQAENLVLDEERNKFWNFYRKREKYDITKPPPYDKDEAYEQKLAEQKNTLPGNKLIATTLK